MTDSALLLATLSRIEGKVDDAKVAAELAAQKADLLDKKMDDHISLDRSIHAGLADRITPLEHWRTRAGGVIAVISVIAGAVFAMLKDAFANTFLHH